MAQAEELRTFVQVRFKVMVIDFLFVFGIVCERPCLFRLVYLQPRNLHVLSVYYLSLRFRSALSSLLVL